MALTELAIKNAKPKNKPYKLSDGGGLFLLVQINGGKYWRLTYRFAYKQKTLTLGIYPDVSLVDARERREQARKLLANDTDSSAIKKEMKRVLQTATVNSFSALARELHKVKAPMWTEGHAKQRMVNMEKYAFPVIGDRPIAEIEPMELVGIMRDVFCRHSSFVGLSLARFQWLQGRDRQHPLGLLNLQHIQCCLPHEDVLLRGTAYYGLHIMQRKHANLHVFDNGFIPGHKAIS
ncbi:MAG: Arm DNA-binding domain-containing protein [Gallionella sp.]|jgi:hypothetical protein